MNDNDETPLKKVEKHDPKMTIHESHPDEVFDMLIPAGAQVSDLFQIKDRDGIGHVGYWLGFVDSQWVVKTDLDGLLKVHWTDVDAIEWYGDR